MSDHFESEPETGDHAPGDPVNAGPPTDPVTPANPWAAADQAPTGPTWTQDLGDTSGAVPPHTDEQPAVGVPTAPRSAQHGVRGRQIFAVAASVAALALAAGSVGYLLGEHGPTTSIGGLTPRQGGPNGFNFTFPGFGNEPGGQSSSSTVPNAVQQSEKALVDINTTIDNSQATGAGTGIVLTSNGLVLTNNHVIDGASSISVTDLGNDQTYPATVVGYDVQRDVAVLRLTGASGLTTASIGGAATSGQTVYAVGNAGGTGGTPTVTSGTITGTNKSVTASDSFDGTSEELHGMLQTSAALISGDSGGALTSASGQVLGVDTAGSSGSGPVGGYAIPIATALSIADQIEAGTASPTIHIGATALLGVQIRPGNQTNGAPVVSVVPGTPAAAAGITAGSRVTSVGGISVSDSAALRSAMAQLAVGSSVKVAWVDAKGVAHTATVTLTGGAPQ